MQKALARFAPYLYVAAPNRRRRWRLPSTARRSCLGFSAGRRVALSSQRGLAGVIEFVGGILIALGLFTSPVAFLASGEMAWAYFQQHAPRGFWPIQNGGELTVLYCFIFLYLSAVGSGKLSIDSIRK